MISTTIQLGHIMFEDVAYTGWSFRELIDWWGQTEDKVEARERPNAHGAFDVSRSLRASRALSFRPQFIGASQAEAERAFDDLASVGADGPVRMVVSTPAGSSARTVTVEKVAPDDHHGRKWGLLAVDLIARDPRRYALSEDTPWQATGPATSAGGLVWPAVWPLTWPGMSSSGQVELANAGRAPSAPVFRLHGGFSSALITCIETGARIGLNRAVPSGSYVEIDTAGRRALLDGYGDVSRFLQWREWELVPAEGSRTFQFDVTGAADSPMLEGRVLSAWW